MSGDYFNYIQYQLDNVADEIEKIATQGREVEYDGIEMYDHYPEDIEQSFLEAANKLREASVYVQRIDWLLSGDDGEDSFRRRLKEDLDKLTKE